MDDLKWTTLNIKCNDVRIQTGVIQTGIPKLTVPPYVITLNTRSLAGCTHLKVTNAFDVRANVTDKEYCGRTVMLKVSTVKTLLLQGYETSETRLL